MYTDPTAMEPMLPDSARTWAPWPWSWSPSPPGPTGRLPPVSAETGASRVSETLWVCGEQVAPPSIHWAVATARAVLDTLGGLAQIGSARHAGLAAGDGAFKRHPLPLGSGSPVR
jgi:hypothetical protein